MFAFPEKASIHTCSHSNTWIPYTEGKDNFWWMIAILWSLIPVGSCTQTNASQLSLLKYKTMALTTNLNQPQKKAKSLACSFMHINCPLKTLQNCERGHKLKFLFIYSFAQISFRTFTNASFSLWHGFITINSKWASQLLFCGKTQAKPR